MSKHIVILPRLLVPKQKISRGLDVIENTLAQGVRWQMYNSMIPKQLKKVVDIDTRKFKSETVPKDVQQAVYQIAKDAHFCIEPLTKYLQ